MRPTLLLVVLVLVLGSPSAAAATDFAPDRVVVSFAPGADPGERADVRADARATLLETVSSPREQVLRITGDPERVAAELERRPEVAFAEPAYVMRAQWAPNDPHVPAQWWLGQTSIPRAWDGARGAGTLVGVVDTGVTFSHPDLGRFDPGGFDFVNNDADPSDDNGHGTGVTGVIAATADNGAGIAGVAPEATIIPGKALAANGSGSTYDVADAVDHLADRGARVVNLSLGGATRGLILTSALARHPATLFVVAAGNDGRDNDSGAAGAATWPCNEPAANVVCVGASTSLAARAGFSSWGAVSVDLMAPGEWIKTTWSDGDYQNRNGTSFAAPMVSGAAALLFGLAPHASVADVRAALLSSVDAVPAFAGITVTGGRLSVARALEAFAPGALPPAPPAPAPAPAPAPVATPAATPTPTPTPTVSRKPTPAPVSCAVPRLKGLTPTRAKQRLLAAGCRAGAIRRQHSLTVRKGRVVSSSPRAGQRARLAVAVAVSRGPAQVSRVRRTR